MMLSTQTVSDLLSVINNIDERIELNRGLIEQKELDYLIYQKIKIQQLVDDMHHKKDYFNSI